MPTLQRTLALLLLAPALACSESGGGRLPGSGGSGSAKVTFQPAVRVLERDEGLGALVGASTDGWTLLFDGKAAKLQSLKPGDILLVKGLIARKVILAEAQPDGTIAVLTQSPSVGEIIQQGHVEVEGKVRFSPQGAWLEPRRGAARGSRWARAASLLEGTARAQNDAERFANAEKKGAQDAAKGMIKNAAKAVYEGWEGTFSAEPADGRVNLDIQLTKSVGGFKALITGKGYVADFDVSSKIDANAGAIDKLEMMAKRVNGRMDFAWQVGKESPGVETGKARIALPGALEIPLYEFLDGLPLFLDISAAVLIEPALTGGGEISKGSFHITYDGYSGVQVGKGGSAEDEGSKMSGDADVDDVANVSAVAPLGMVVAFAAPRIELTFGLGKIKAFKEAGEQIKKAAERVDAIAELLIKKAFGDDGWAKWKESTGGFSLGGATDAALKSNATAFLEFETSAGMTHSGSSTIVPCTQRQLHFSAVVGAGAQFLGAKGETTPKTIYKKDLERIDPPNLKMCQ